MLRHKLKGIYLQYKRFEKLAINHNSLVVKCVHNYLNLLLGIASLVYLSIFLWLAMKLCTDNNCA